MLYLSHDVSAFRFISASFVRVAVRSSDPEWPHRQKLVGYIIDQT